MIVIFGLLRLLLENFCGKFNKKSVERWGGVKKCIRKEIIWYINYNKK